jgi:hypothetical protein
LTGQRRQTREARLGGGFCAWFCARFSAWFRAFCARRGGASAAALRTELAFLAGLGQLGPAKLLLDGLFGLFLFGRRWLARDHVAREGSPAGLVHAVGLDLGQADAVGPAGGRRLGAAAQGAVTTAPAPRVAPAASAAGHPAPAIAAPATFQNRPQTTDAPNLRSDDAPPMLPASLRALSSTGVGRAWDAGPVVALPPVVAAAPAPQNEVEPIFASDAPPAPSAQPASVAPSIDRRVQPASAEEPQGIQLINPAAAVVVDPGEDGLQQAIYFEASDLDAP